MLRTLLVELNVAFTDGVVYFRLDEVSSHIYSHEYGTEISYSVIVLYFMDRDVFYLELIYKIHG